MSWQALGASANRSLLVERLWQHGRVTASFYDRVGGEQTFRDLVDGFYQGVAGDPPLRALYPEEDLGPAADRLRLFLVQYWGGPRTYQETRGHPRLRIRHAPFQVTPTQRELLMLDHFERARLCGAGPLADGLNVRDHLRVGVGVQGQVGDHLKVEVAEFMQQRG